MVTRITYKEKEFEVIFEFYKGEPATYDYPGCPDSIVVEKLLFMGEDFTELIYDKHSHEIDELIWEQL
jgi:hypothetical protein